MGCAYLSRTGLQAETTRVVRRELSPYADEADKRKEKEMKDEKEGDLLSVPELRRQFELWKERSQARKERRKKREIIDKYHAKMTKEGKWIWGKKNIQREERRKKDEDGPR